MGAAGQLPLDQLGTLNAPSPVQTAPALSPSTGVASFDAAGVFEQAPPAPVPPPPNPASQGPLPGALPGSPPGTPGGPPAAEATACPPAASSVRPDWLARVPARVAGSIATGAAPVLSRPTTTRSIRAAIRPKHPAAQRRALPESWPSPPFPGHEFQGYPLVGVPISPHSGDPLMTALKGTWLGNWLTDNRIDMYGWVTGSYNWSTSQHSNQPDSYWIVPNRAEVDQAVLRFERQADMVQTDHLDWGFRFTNVYGIDYRYLIGRRMVQPASAAWRTCFTATIRRKSTASCMSPGSLKAW